jgi:hypothetical protein
MYPAIPYNASRIYGIYKMKWNEIKFSLQGTTLLADCNQIKLVAVNVHGFSDMFLKKVPAMEAKILPRWCNVLQVNCLN